MGSGRRRGRTAGQEACLVEAGAYGTLRAISGGIPPAEAHRISWSVSVAAASGSGGRRRSSRRRRDGGRCNKPGQGPH